MTQPIDQLVSILLPLHNAEQTLKECLDSLLSQTYTPIEIIAIDDNSKDKTYTLLRQYRRRDKRLIISRNVKRYGLTVTLNRALKKANGSYLAFMNQKDTSTTDRLKRQVFYLKRHPKVVAVGTQTIFTHPLTQKIDKSTFPTDHHTISKTFLTSDALQLESIMINRYLLPSDLLKFESRKYPILYRTLLTKMLPYGTFANLNQYLYLRAREEQVAGIRKNVLPHLTLWLRARFIYGSGISLNSLLYPVNNRLKSTF